MAYQTIILMLAYQKLKIHSVELNSFYFRSRQKIALRNDAAIDYFRIYDFRDTYIEPR